MEFPNWEKRLIMLRELEIHSCKNLKVLPALGRLEFLECLKLEELDSVSQMGLEVLGVLNGDSSAPVIAFPKLKKLTIWNMEHWEEWLIPTTITVMPLLQGLGIYNCPIQLSAFGVLVPSPISGEVGLISRCRFSFDIITHTKWSLRQSQVSSY
ncbi:hypothetical protein GIB67_006020 [Kingdonia uniflora]|uniref:R13L1/DRL21-like LRR repeat region domain-containing protein n=1 Tax=Kingdonia uniflora TaxID=39325 RepID=A0A7J7MBU7_9MAGN|nr:hypothetical protein GIB67_006020 [Kingdonia uniflora]